MRSLIWIMGQGLPARSCRCSASTDPRLYSLVLASRDIPDLAQE